MAKNGKTPKNKMTDTERGTLIENIGRDVTRIAEAQAATAEKVSKMEKLVDRIPAIESAIDTISTAVMQIGNDVKSLTKKVDENLANHDKRITKLEEKVLV